MAKAVAYQATLSGYDVRYVEADTEFARYGLASAAEQAQQLKDWVEADLLVLDDLFAATVPTHGPQQHHVQQRQLDRHWHQQASPHFWLDPIELHQELVHQACLALRRPWMLRRF